MTSENPYVGPQTFTEAQARLYFGREREAADLFARVLSERLVLFYGQSGAGKSSLINTRLVPQLRKAGFAVLPVARVSGVVPDGLTAIDNIFLFHLMLGLDSSRREPGRFAQMSLNHFLSGLSTRDRINYVYKKPVAQAASPSAVPCVLIVDQFEELITTSPAQWRQREAFFRQLNQAMLDDPRLWVVLSFREDYLAPIEIHAPLMHDRMRARFYMERLGVAAALEAVREPAREAGRPFDAGVAERLVDDLRQVRISGQEGTAPGQFVEPVQLQVVCYQLWSKIEDSPPGPITFEQLRTAGDVTSALITFYQDVIAAVLGVHPGLVSERQLRTWFEQELITPDRTRGLIRQGDADTGSMPNAVVAELQRRFLLRSDTRAGDPRIELVHDRFVEPILASNQAWRLQNQNPLVLKAEVWLNEGRSPRKLLAGAELRAAAEQLEAARAELTETERQKVEALLEASEGQERRRGELLAAERMARLEPQKYISEMGWGVIFPAIPPSDEERSQQLHAIREALRPLLEHRKAEATLRRPEYYREFLLGDGYREGETTYDFLARHGVGPGNVEPALMPYYLLLVGDPETIPFEFQYQLDVQYAVGRIQFATPDEYRRYAESVVSAETGTRTRPQRVALFAPRPPHDKASEIISTTLIQPLVERLQTTRPDWSLTPALADFATRARLGRLLGGDETPALAVIAAHGMHLSPGHEHQLDHQGAPICQDWPGPDAVFKQFPRAFYFTGDDLAQDADLLGLIAFVFAEYSAGTPKFNNFYRMQRRNEQNAIAKRPFLARLPQRLLSHPGGGALAFIGHVDLGWTFTLSLRRADESTGMLTFASVVEQLLDGCPVGAAVEPFNRRYGELAALLAQLKLRKEQGATVDDLELTQIEGAVVDARNWIVVGDPAVRLMVQGLRPDLAGLRLSYQVENLRREGDRLAEEGDLEAAGTKYQQVLDLHPWLGFEPAAEARAAAARGFVRRAKTLARGGKIEEAVAQSERAVALNPALGGESLQEIGRLAAPFYLDKGRAAANAGQYEEALQLLRKAAELDPILSVDAEVEAKPLVAKYHFEQGRAAARAGKVEAAVAHYEQARAFDPQLTGDFDPAQPLVPQAEAARYAAEYFRQHGAELGRQGDRAGATEAFRQAVLLDPATPLDPEQEAARLAALHEREQQRMARQQTRSIQAPEAGLSADDDRLWFNGVHASTGGYLTPPVSVEQVGKAVRDQPDQPDRTALYRQKRKSSTSHF